MHIHNFIRYSDIYCRTSGNLRQYYRDEPTLSNAGSIIDLPSNNNNNINNNNSVSFKSKEKITGQADNNGTQDVEIMVPAKYLSHFCKNLEMNFISWEINLIRTSIGNCFIAAGTVGN